MSNRRRITWAIICIAMGALAPTSAAWAAVTSSQITSPADPTFAISDGDAPNTIAVSGTTAGGTVGDKVDLDCFYNSVGTLAKATLAADVDIDGDGSFSAPAADPANISDRVCRLRAVPAGTSAPFPDLSPFAGPVMATGERETYKVGSVLNPDVVDDYYVWGQQLTGADDYYSAGDCGLDSAYLFDSSFERTAVTFECADYWSFKNGDNTRSELQVDGADAYLPGNLFTINNEASGYPALTYSYSQNPLNGDLTIEESNPVVKCASDDFPPDATSCPSVSSTGVRIDRTIEQTDDGHLVTIADRFVSTDGKAHSVDSLSENDQYFNGNGPNIAYKFPGEASYSMHAEGEDVSFSSDTPGVIDIHVDSSTDGDQTTGRGAIVFDRPASPAHFKYVSSIVSEFEVHQSIDVPANGSSQVRFAYASAYTQAEVDALARQAKNAFTPSAPSPIVGPPIPNPSNKIRIRKVKLNKRNGTAKLFVKVPGAGILKLIGRRVHGVKRKVSRHGTFALNVIPKPKFAKKLRSRGHLRVGLRVIFRPTGGTARVNRTHLTLVRNGSPKP
jgi:hypothetical protein